jgi:hypothetical protein
MRKKWKKGKPKNLAQAKAIAHSEAQRICGVQKRKRGK